MKSPAVILRYALLQIPGYVVLIGILYLLIHHGVLETGTAFIVFGVWLIKDALMYPIVWKAYSTDGNDDRSRLRGEFGVVVETCSPHGRIKVHGTYWQAIAIDATTNLEPGTRVKILGDIEGMTLIVSEADQV